MQKRASIDRRRALALLGGSSALTIGAAAQDETAGRDLFGHRLASGEPHQGADLGTDRGTFLDDKRSEIASVRDFRFAGGAIGDGVSDDSAAFQAALNAEKKVLVPPGRYFLGSTVTLNDGQLIKGAGKSAWEPYTGGAFPEVYRSEIRVNGILAFDATGSNSARIEGLAIKATGGTQSAFGTAAGKQVGARGINITSSTQFEARDISFHGLEVAVDANQGTNEPSAQMPLITDWMASDCGTVFRFGTVTSGTDGVAPPYTVRDPCISKSVVALHCDKMVEAHYCDGFRLENVRLFQAFNKSIFIRATPFVTLNGVTAFETAQDQVTLKDCVSATLSGLNLSRAGAYNATLPYAQKTALTLNRCTNVSVSGTIRQPTGRAIDMIGCDNTQIACSIETPYWTSGNAQNTSGPVNILASKNTVITSSFGGTAYWVSVFADLKSSRTLSGSVSGDISTGVGRAVQLQHKGGFTHRIDAAADIGSYGVLTEVAFLRAWLPEDGIVRARCVEITCPTAQLRVVVGGEAVVWMMTDQGDGTGVSFDDCILIDNSGGAAGYYGVELTLRNPSGSVITVPRGTEIRISTAITDASRT